MIEMIVYLAVCGADFATRPSSTDGVPHYPHFYKAAKHVTARSAACTSLL